jgi:hypothetical protein
MRDETHSTYALFERSGRKGCAAVSHLVLGSSLSSRLSAGRSSVVVYLAKFRLELVV